MKKLLPAVLLVAATLGGCSMQLEYNAPDPATDVTTASATPTPEATVAAAVPAPAAPAAKPAVPAPASVDYITPVTNRWHGCFTKLGIGDLYYDEATSTVGGGPVTWNVGPGNESGTPADPQSEAALAGC